MRYFPLRVAEPTSSALLDFRYRYRTRAASRSPLITCGDGHARWALVLAVGFRAGFPTSMLFVVGTRFLIVEDGGFRNSPAVRVDFL